MKKNLNVPYILVQVLFNAIYLGVAGFASVFLTYAGFSDALIGTVVSAATIISIIIQPIIGNIVDNSKFLTEKKMNIFMIGFTLICAVILLAFPKSMFMTGAAYIIMTCCLTMEIAFSVALGFAHISRGAKINFSLARGLGSLGYSAASFGLGKLVGAMGEGVILPFVIVCCILGIVVVCFFPEIGKNTAETGEKKEIKKESLIAFAKKNKRFMLFVVATLLVFYSHMIHATYLYQITLNIGGDAEQFATIASVCALIELPAMAVAPALMKRFNLKKLLVFSAAFFVIKLVIFGLARDITLIWVGTMLQMFSFAWFTPFSNYYVNYITKKEENNTAQSLLNFGREGATILAALIGGIMLTLSNGDPQGMCWSGAIISAIGVIMMAIVAQDVGVRPVDSNEIKE